MPHPLTRENSQSRQGPASPFRDSTLPPPNCRASTHKPGGGAARTRNIPPKGSSDWIKTRDKYKKYQYKTAVTIGKSVLGVVSSAVSLAGAVGTYGATLPLSIIAL